MKAEDLQLGVCWYPPPEGLARWPHPSRWGIAEWRHWCMHGPQPMSEQQFAQYWHDRHYWGFSTNQIDKKGAVIRTDWHYQPGPKAVPFHMADEEFVLYGGARGGMKSHSLRWEMHARCARFPGYRAILFRRLHEELKLYHVDRSRYEVKAITNGVGRVIGDDEVDYGNGSILKFGHCKDPGDEEKYLGSEWDFIGFDQMETFATTQLVDIMGAGRSAKEGVKSLVRGTANPGGVSPQWLIDRFMTKTPPEDDRLAYDPAQWRYIPARVYDNPFLMDADGTFTRQEGRLAQYSPIRRRQMLLGDWDAREGQFYPELMRDTHMAALEIPAGTRWYLGMDYGSLRPGVCVWVAAFPSGRLYVRHEYKFQGKQLTAAPREHDESPAGYQARAERAVSHYITGINQRYGIKPHSLVCDPDLGNNKTGGETGIDSLRRVGLPAVAGDNSRVLGWLRLRQWLATAPDGKPWMMFHPEASYVWRSMTGVVSDKTEPDDVDTGGDDHGADALRYVTMSRPSPDGRHAGRVKYARGTVGDMICREQGKKGMARVL